jgi:flagellar hook-basal body complex protein FliE
MDGLSIRQSLNMADQGVTSSELRGVKPLAPSVGGSSQADGKSFAETLSEAVKSTNELQKTSDAKMQDLATGKTADIPDVMIAAEKADIAMRLMVNVRNKMIEAYQEIMRMQV